MHTALKNFKTALLALTALTLTSLPQMALVAAALS